MKLVSYLREEHDQLALLIDGLLFDMEYLHPDLPGNISMFLNYWSDFLPLARLGELAVQEGHIDRAKGIPYDSAFILAPVPYPGSCRDGYAFRQHVATARRNRGLPMIEAFDQFPVFYFTNHHSVQGPGNVRCMPDHFDRLDFELEVAVVICKQGRNIRAEAADAYIGGLMVMNDSSARTLQMEEMVLNLGPAKGKDFSTATGPWLVTTDELEQREIAAPPGHSGKAWDLPMRCWVNGAQLSDGNLRDMDWTFAEIIERASYGAELFPGDIIGSGTVGTGCLLELNGTARMEDPALTERWLQEGDKVEMEIEGLGRLENLLIREEEEFSILALKKTHTAGQPL